MNAIATQAPIKEPKQQLNPYNFDPKDLEKLVNDNKQANEELKAAIDLDITQVDDKLIKAAKKARTALKNKLADIKKVHTENKKKILQFKKDSQAYDESKCFQLQDIIIPLFESLDDNIKSIEDYKLQAEQALQRKINDVNNNFNEKLLDAKSPEDVHKVINELNQFHVDPAVYGAETQNVTDMIGQFKIKAATREHEVQQLNGLNDVMKKPEVEPLKNVGDAMDDSPKAKYTDSELINFLQQAGSAKGYKVMISPTTGVSLYQVDDSKAPKSVRVALTEALDEHNANSI